jgi:enoyl-CoA hydratase/carnithine racemase
VSGPVAERSSETLDAALVDPGAAQLLRTGQLTSALRHVGFGVVDETGEPAQLAPVTPRILRRAPAKKTPTKAVTKQPAKRADRADTADDVRRRRRAELQARADELQTAYDEAEADRAAATGQRDMPVVPLSTRSQVAVSQAPVQSLPGR